MLKFVTVLVDKSNNKPVAVCTGETFALAVLEHIPISAFLAITKEGFNQQYKAYSRQLITFHELAGYIAKHITSKKIIKIAENYFNLYPADSY